MKYCPTCGSQIPEGTNFCPNCGTSVETNQQPQPQAPVENQTNTTSTQRVLVTKKSIVTCIILSLVTCGIYGIIWYVNLVNDVNTVCQDDKSSQGGGVVFLLTLITCGIYGWYWFYTAGKRMQVAGQKYNTNIDDNSVMYLILAIVGLGIINYCLLQSDLNKYAA